jgi:hypothetical protein
MTTQYTLPSGTVVHIGGVPYELNRDTEVLGTDVPVAQTYRKNCHPFRVGDSVQRTSGVICNGDGVMIGEVVTVEAVGMTKILCCEKWYEASQFQAHSGPEEDSLLKRMQDYAKDINVSVNKVNDRIDRLVKFADHMQDEADERNRRNVAADNAITKRIDAIERQCLRKFAEIERKADEKAIQVGDTVECKHRAISDRAGGGISFNGSVVVTEVDGEWISVRKYAGQFRSHNFRIVEEARKSRQPLTPVTLKPKLLTVPMSPEAFAAWCEFCQKPADDSAEPITEEWLLSIGFNGPLPNRTGQHFEMWKIEIIKHWSLNEWYVSCHSIFNLTTRRDVRLLCELLRIELKKGAG